MITKIFTGMIVLLLFCQVSGQDVELADDLKVEGDLEVGGLRSSTEGKSYVEVDINGRLSRRFDELILAIGARSFDVDDSRDGFRRGIGVGTAYITEGSGGLSAPVNLPQGATITKIRLWYIDHSIEDATFRLSRSFSGSTGSEILTSFTPGGSLSGFRSVTDPTISGGPVDNEQYTYYFRVFCHNWTGDDIGIKAVVIYYVL